MDVGRGWASAGTAAGPAQALLSPAEGPLASPRCRDKRGELFKEEAWRVTAEFEGGGGGGGGALQ